MLTGKTALITGASRGIGRAIAIELAQNGADIAIIYAENGLKAEEVRARCAGLGVHARIYPCDVSDFDMVKDTVARVKADFGRIDILVNNAGITRDGLTATMKEPAFDEVIATNLKGSFNLIRHCCPIFIRARAGTIINISSVSGLMGNGGQANYCAAKAGVIGLTKSIARELAPRGITCNAVAPGFIETDMTADLEAGPAVLASIPLGRTGSVRDVAKAVLFLAGDGAGYITGEVLRVDGGMAM